jgi:hypothetical protein
MKEIATQGILMVVKQFNLESSAEIVGCLSVLVVVVLIERILKFSSVRTTLA